MSLTMAEDGASVYTGDQATDQILRVDLETGDREAVETCPLGSSQTLQQVFYHGAANELLILSSDQFLAFDLETSMCTSIPSRLSPLGFAVTPGGQILGANFNQLTQIDRQSGDVVIVSK